MKYVMKMMKFACKIIIFVFESETDLFSFYCSELQFPINYQNFAQGPEGWEWWILSAVSLAVIFQFCFLTYYYDDESFWRIILTTFWILFEIVIESFETFQV